MTLENPSKLLTDDLTLSTRNTWSLAHMGAFLQKRARELRRRLRGTMANNGGHSGEAVAKYVGYKISRVRWKPQPSGAILSSQLFATGSWDDEVRSN